MEGKTSSDEAMEINRDSARRFAAKQRTEKIDAIMHDVRAIAPISFWAPLRNILEAHL